MTMQDKTESELTTQLIMFEDSGFEKFFDEEKDKWKMKMIDTLGDLQQYNFTVLYGHPDYQLDDNFLSKEKKKVTPFESLQEMSNVDKVAQNDFQEILTKIDVEKEINFHEVMQERRKECTGVLEQFDKIVDMSEKYFELDYAHCQKRSEEQLSLQKPMINEVDKYLSEVEEAGNREIQVLKDNIANYVKELGASWSNQIEEIYDEMNKDPPLIEAWSKSTEILTSKDIRCGFLKLQRETGLLWKKAFEDLLMLSSELEKYRYSYTQTKSELERAIYWMNRNYRDNMPELTKTQRKINSLVEKRGMLFRELADIEKEIKKEKERKLTLRLSYKDNVSRRESYNDQAAKDAYARNVQVFEIKKLEAIDLLKEIVEGDRFIHEEILKKPWIPVELTSLETENLTEEKFVKLNETEDHPVIFKDKFSDSLKLVVSDRNFEKLLTQIANQLGFMLDFRWIDYVQKTLEIEKEIRWIKLFKVFKIDFVDDLKDLKNHMSKFSKMKGKERVFDLNGAIDGFLEFAALKSQQGKEEARRVSPSASKTELYHNVWASVEEKIPKSLLWEGTAELLAKYREALNNRKVLQAKRSAMVKENDDLDKCLMSYYSYNQVPKPNNYPQ